MLRTRSALNSLRAKKIFATQPTDTSQLGKSYETRLVQNLPIFGNQNTLALLSLNVAVRGAGTQGTGCAVGGTRVRSNVFTVDGVGKPEL